MYTIIYYMLILSSMFVDETANDQSLAFIDNRFQSNCNIYIDFGLRCNPYRNNYLRARCI